ncbi:MAG: hsp70 family protein [Gemmatales bacterium]|nr:hsp70 family protein [Gemmatales bacterium]MDW8387920.1 Hsp70 family protein [Gemmatales bacterium]
MGNYLVGIDLGTTNSALAYVDLKRSGPLRLCALGILQLVGLNDVAPRYLLPSFLYLPGAHDLPAGACALPWDPDRNYVVGEFARQHGSRVPGRLATSAKSWLCHAGVDRQAPLLPWGAPPDVPRLSPVEVSTRYLRHLAEAWNHTLAAGKSEQMLEKQQIVLTVPASFDDVARTLTLEAARKAGFENVVLLEEPQAAFYSWMAVSRGVLLEGPAASEEPSRQAAKALEPGMICLVVDVGGGTTDFSLIRAEEQEGDIGFVRLAVGDHLLLGGDNMDLALARFVESKLPRAGSLDAATLGQLVQACRAAKETLLGPHPPSEYTVTVMGRGRAVIGGALHARLTPEEVRGVIEEGFFPQVPATAEPRRSGRTGLHELGLPYVQDPAITSHLAAFLREHEETRNRPPDAILFNGGVFQPRRLRERLVQVMRTWYAGREGGWNPLVLASPSLDLAVAWGAAYFAWLRHTGGRRIGGGLARSYYIGVAPPSETEDRSRLNVVCVVPQHLEEGSEIILDEPHLELALGQPVTFPLFTSTVRGKDRAGELLHLEPRQLLRLPPLHTVLRGGKRSGTKSVPVKLAARLTEIGTLELSCLARNSDNRWRLEFNTRDVLEDEGDSQSSAEVVLDVWEEDRIQAAAAVLRRAFQESSETGIKEVIRNVEAALEASRENWPLAVCRRLWDFLAELADHRRKSPAHLARWYNLAGWCLRPGFGDPLDRHRVEQLWKLLHSLAAKPGQASLRIGEGGPEWWILWRRVAGGLPAPLQNSLWDRLRPILLPSKGSKGSGYKPGPHELAEMWRAAASLERLDLRWKQQLGDALLREIRRPPVPSHVFWALTRLGSRRLVYGPLNAVLHPEVVSGWIETLSGFSPNSDQERQNWQFCLAQLAQKTGQRALDVSESVREQVSQRLRESGASDRLLHIVEEGTPLDAAEQKQMLGDVLPIGLKLASSPE